MVGLEVNDKIGIDLVFGLPESKEGFGGVMVITKYLTKYPFVKPIKSKTSEEISLGLWEYISIFGPSKIIVSDRGTEFFNQLISYMVTRIGTEHRVTSANHPRSNDQIERFNGILIGALRKHAVEDKKKWPNMIPYVLIAYRIKIHATTEYTQFELMFSRPMNKFECFRLQRVWKRTSSVQKKCRQLTNGSKRECKEKQDEADDNAILKSRNSETETRHWLSSIYFYSGNKR